MDMRFGMWNVRRLYRAGSLMTVSRELSKYKLDLVECRRSDERVVALNLRENTYCSTKRGMRIISVTRILTDRILYITLRDRYVISLF
jgi:hypothetical protein